MALLDTFETSQPLIVDVAASAAVLNQWRRNLYALDDATRLLQYAYCGGFGHPQERTRQNPYRESWGAFRFENGMTTLTAVTRCSGITAGDQLRLYLAGALVTTWNLANGAQTHTATLPNSFSRNQAIDVAFEVFNASKTTDPDAEIWGDIEIIAAYVSPVTVGDPYPGLPPAFSSALDCAATEQIASSLNWLVRQVGLRTRPAFQSVIRWHGPFQGQTSVRWFGSIQRSPIHAVLKANGSVIVMAPGATEQIRLRVDGATVATYNVPTVPGEYGFTLSYAMPQAAGSRLSLEVDHIRTAGGDSGQTPLTRFTLYRVWAEDSSGTAGLSIPELPTRQLVAWPTLRAFLNACITGAAAIKARIDANPDLWARQYLFRRRYAYDDYQNGLFEPGMVATFFERAGNSLIVRGKSIKAGFGPQAFADQPDDKQFGLYPFEATRAENLVDGDQVETVLVNLDVIDGLFGGDPYNLRGVDLHYAGEVLRI